MPREVKDWESEWKKIAAESRKLAKRANQRLVRLERAAEKPGMENILKYAYKTAVADTKTLGKTKGKSRFKENVKLVDIYDKNGKLITGPEMFRKNVMSQKQKIKMMKEFLGSASSTIGAARSGIKEGIDRSIGVKRIWDKTTKTINKKFLKDYDLRMSDNDMKRFFDSRKQAKLEQLVGSGRMFIVASYIKKHNIKTNKRELEKFFKSHIKLEGTDLTAEDLKARKGESYKEYIDRLDEYVKYTDDEVLNSYITKALKNGINVNNIFSQESDSKKKK